MEYTLIIAEVNEVLRALLESSLKRVETEHVTGYKMPNIVRLDIKTNDN